MTVGILTLTLYLPDCHSLKEKRRLIKPILARLHKEFNISVVEYGHQDALAELCPVDRLCGQPRVPCGANAFKQVVAFYERHWPDLPLTNENIEIIT
jgi:uncharacterized protein